jgi:conjugal transfer pilus assembly protein TraF
VSAYLYAQRVMLERSDNFATVAARLAQTDPYLDENNRVPFSTAMRSLTMKTEGEARRDIMKQLSKKAGLFFFFDSRCRFCVIQRQMVDVFAQQHGFIVYNISVDGKPLPGMKDWRRDNGKFRELGLTMTPTVVLAVPPDQYLVLAQGAMSLDAFESRVLVAAEDRSLLPAEVLRTARVYDRGRITADDLKSLGIEGDPDDPKAWIALVRKKLGTAY